MKLFKPNMKLVALAFTVAGFQFLMSLGASDTSDKERTQQTSFECEYGNFDQCRAQCDIGNGDSCSHLGVMYVNGVGVEKDEAEAGKLYQKACNLNSADGCYALYSAHLYGVGMPRDERQAETVAEKACRLGHEDSCTFIRRLELVRDTLG